MAEILEAVVHENLDTEGSHVREEVSVVRTSTAVGMHDMSHQALGAGTHVQWLGALPQGIDTDHRNSSRRQAAQSTAAETGHMTLTSRAPRGAAHISGTAVWF
jgi:hypothetical protein